MLKLQVINEYVYSLLEKEGLNRLPLPKQSSITEDKKSFIFASNDALENEKILILIHGSGVVRAGQWARRLIINDSLFTGTQIPYIRKAKDLGYGLFVLNTNDNVRIIKGKTNKIKVFIKVCFNKVMYFICGIYFVSETKNL